jgi:hypothetical protein
VCVRTCVGVHVWLWLRWLELMACIPGRYPFLGGLDLQLFCMYKGTGCFEQVNA